MQDKRKFRTRASILVVIWVILLVLSLLLLSILFSLFASNPESESISSLSWAGYITTKNANPQFEVVGISSSWTVPTLNDTAATGYSSAWIGIGGQLDKTLIQAGTEQDVVNGQENYYAWYELLPSFAIQLRTLTVSPGDTIVASINLVNPGTNQWSIQISDTTTGQTFGRDVLYNSTRSSGEWIVERPTINGQVSQLSNFGNTTFSNCRIDVSNITGSITKFPFSKIEMADSQSAPLTSVSNLSPDGSSFTVSYLANK